MAQVLSTAATSLDNLFPDQTNYNVTSNISLMSSCNMSGINPCFPTIAPSTTLLGNYHLSFLDGLNDNLSAHRTLQPSVNPATTLSNSWYVTYAGNYRVTAYTSACSVYKNGVINCIYTSTLRGVISLSSLSIGDIVSVTTPATLYHSTHMEVLHGSLLWLCWLFFCIKRVDRNTPKFFYF